MIYNIFSELVEFPREENEITFTFKTDSSGQNKGFYIEIQRVRGTCRDSKLSQVLNGMFSAFDSM